LALRKKRLFSKNERLALLVPRLKREKGTSKGATAKNEKCALDGPRKNEKKAPLESGGSEKREIGTYSLGLKTRRKHL